MLSMSDITAPKITLIAASEDKLCPYATAETIKTDLGDTLDSFITIEGKDHTYFAYANSDEFIGNLTSQLVIASGNAVTGAAVAMTSLVLSAFMLS